MPTRFWGLLVLALAVASVAGLAFGSVSIAPAELWALARGGGDAGLATIVWTLRLPRLVLAAGVGAGLAVSGCALQRTLRNPLAEPYLLGVSGGAAVGAVIAQAIGAAVFLLPIAAFVGAGVAVLLVLGVARAVAGRADTRTLLMSGVVVGAFANAAIMIVLAGASEQAVRGALWWMMGSVGAADWRSAAMVWGYVLVGGAALFAWGRALDAIALGEEFAASVGVRVDRLVPRLFLVAALVAAATVAGAGLIGFVGLIVPAVARALGARGTRAQLVAAALAGATLVIGADVIARTVRAPLELPLGAVTALIGVPFFLLRLRRAAAA